MKSLLLAAIIPIFCLFQSAKLNGTYKVVYDKGQQGYQITFTDSGYSKRMPDAITYKGVPDYGKFKVTIRQNKEEDPIEIDNREIGKDTIAFATKSKRDLSLTINRGKMIRVK
jgi:hypothetical protein